MQREANEFVLKQTELMNNITNGDTRAIVNMLDSFTD